MPSLSVLVILSLALNAVQASYEDPWVASKFPKRQKGPEMPTVHRNLLLLQGDFSLVSSIYDFIFFFHWSIFSILQFYNFV